MRAFENCMLCPRKCRVNRTAGEAGRCRSGNVMRIARAEPHFWEEPVISGRSGSGAVFFSGCGLGCIYCQNYDISSKQRSGKEVTPKELSDIFRSLEDRGVHNINLVTAAHFAPLVAEALSIRKPGVPVVYNSSGYESIETLKLFKGLVDIYLPDFKYVLEEPAARYSLAPDYPQTAVTAIEEMISQCSNEAIADGIMEKGVIIRHLVLPLNVKGTMAVLKTVKERFPGIKLSLMSQYIPCGRAKDFPEINRKVTSREYEKAVNEMIRLNIDGYIQDSSAASEKYIPSFTK